MPNDDKVIYLLEYYLHVGDVLVHARLMGPVVDDDDVFGEVLVVQVSMVVYGVRHADYERSEQAVRSLHP